MPERAFHRSKSAVSAEFRAYRECLVQYLARVGVRIEERAGLIQNGTPFAADRDMTTHSSVPRTPATRGSFGIECGSLALSQGCNEGRTAACSTSLSNLSRLARTSLVSHIIREVLHRQCHGSVRLPMASCRVALLFRSRPPGSFLVRPRFLD